MKHIAIAFITLFIFSSCTKTVTNDIYIPQPATNTIQKDTVIVIDTTKVPIAQTMVESLNGDSINFDAPRNIMLTPGLNNYTGKINIWLNPKDAIVGVVVNIYVTMLMGSACDVYTHLGLVYKENVPANPQAFVWHYQVTYMGMFNGGECVFNVITSTY